MSKRRISLIISEVIDQKTVIGCGNKEQVFVARVELASGRFEG